MNCPTCAYPFDPARGLQCPRCGTAIDCSTVDCASCAACPGGLVGRPVRYLRSKRRSEDDE